MSQSPSSEPCFDPTDDQVLAAARSILAGKGVPSLAAYIDEVCFVGPETELEQPKLRFLLGYWAAARERGGRGFVGKQDVDIVELKVAMGNLMLLDVEREGLDARYRVYGTNIADHAGRDWTGYRVSEMNRESKTPLALLYRAGYRAVWECGQPLYSNHKSLPWLGARAWQRLILPLCGDDGRCLQFLVGNIPVQPTQLSYEDRVKIRRYHSGS